MLTVKNSVIESRREQLFPALEQAEIDRMRRFGESRAFAPATRRPRRRERATA